MVSPRRAGDAAPARPASMPAMSPRAWRAVLAVALTAALYGNTLGNALVWDDRLVAMTPPGFAELLGRRTGPYYRPLVMLSFRADRALWGARPAGYHLTNLLAHAATAVLVGELAVAAGLSAAGALLATLAFVAHPVQADAVAYVSGRTDVLCAFWALAALLAWRRARSPLDRWAVASSALFLAALLSKETAGALALVFLVPALHPGRPRPRPVLPLLVALAWATAYLGTLPTGRTAGSLWERMPGVVMVAVEYLGLLALPLDLHVERYVPVRGWSPAALAGGVALLLVALALLVRQARRLPGGLVLLALAAAAYAPASGVVPVYPAIADRWLFAPEHFLYVPLAGLASLGAAAALAPAIRSRAPRLVPALLVTLLAIWGGLVVERNQVWRDEATLFADALAYDPPAARLWFNLGNHELAAGRLEDAARLYAEAITREPHDAAVHLNLGIVRQRQGRLGAAEEAYRAVLRLDPDHDGAARALAALLARRGAIDEAAAVLGRVGPAAKPAHPDR